MTQVGRYVPDALSEAGVGTAGGAAELLQASYGAGDLEARGHMEAAAPHLDRETVRRVSGCKWAQRGKPIAGLPRGQGREGGSYRESGEQRLRELGLEGVQQLFGAGVIEGQEAWGAERGQDGSDYWVPGAQGWRVWVEPSGRRAWPYNGWAWPHIHGS